MLVVALVGLGVAWARRSRFGVWLTTLTAIVGRGLRARPPGLPVERAAAAVLVLRGLAHLRMALRCDGGLGGAALAPARRGALDRRRPRRGAPPTRFATAPDGMARGRRRGGRRGARRRRRRGPADDLARAALGAHRDRDHARGERGARVGGVQLHRLPGRRRLVVVRQGLGRVPRGDPDDGARRAPRTAAGSRCGSTTPPRRLRDDRVADAAAVLDGQLHRVDGGAALRVVRHDAVPLPQPVRAVAAAVGPDGGAPVRALRLAERRARPAPPPAPRGPLLPRATRRRSCAAAIRSHLVTPLATTRALDLDQVGAGHDADLAPLLGARRTRRVGPRRAPERRRRALLGRRLAARERGVVAPPVALGRLPRRRRPHDVAAARVALPSQRPTRHDHHHHHHRPPRSATVRWSRSVPWSECRSQPSR